MAAGGSAVPPFAGTREDVHVTGRRILATVVDGLIFGLLFVVMAALFGTITRTGAFGWDASMPALPSAAYAVLVVLYYVLMEGYLGQTVGKMLMSIKVVREDDGGVPGFQGRDHQDVAAHRGRAVQLPGCLRDRPDLGQESAPGGHGGAHLRRS